MKDMRKGNAKVLASVFGGLMLAMIPSASFAESPEIDCNSLPESEMEKFYELSGEFGAALEEKDFEKALPIAQKAMSMCTTDTYTEYSLARIYQLSGDCASAYYHFERLSNRGTALKKENPDIYKEVNKHFKTIKSNCGDVVSLEIECAQSGVKLSMNGLPNSNASCPFYGKVSPGSYSLTATKEGFQPYKELIMVSESGQSVKIGALKPIKKTVQVSIQCPHGSVSFDLIDPKGEKNTYKCPQDNLELELGTYQAYLSNSDKSNAITFEVTKEGETQFKIPTTSSSCSATPNSNQTTPFAALFMLIAGLGFGVMRRRTNRAE